MTTIKTQKITYTPTLRKARIGSKLNPNAGAYGVRIDEANTSPDLERIGKAELHALLPVHNSMKPCLLLDSGVVNYYLNPTDWTKKMDGTPSVRDGSDGQVMIEVPTYYRNVVNSAAGYMIITFHCFLSPDGRR